jgi:Protein of unknown function (DUF3429)
MSTVIEQRIANLLGNLGLVPFFVLAILRWLPWRNEVSLQVQFALVGYTAVILSFLGAVHWGLALANPGLDKVRAWNALGWGVTPSLLGWLALLMLMLGLPAALILAFLIGDLLLVRVVDGQLVHLYATPVPSWYLSLRTRLTLGASLCLLAALVAAFPH